MKPIHKFNGGKGATLCHTCRVTISVGLTDDLYCNKCNTMEKEFVPYEQALELEELDFDEPCYLSSLFNEESGGFISTPLYQQSFRWFREKHNIAHSIDWMTRSGGEYPSGYIVHFRGINGNELNEHNLIVLNITEVLGYEVFPTYEEAELACLKKLIEMVKTKQNGKENNA